MIQIIRLYAASAFNETKSQKSQKSDSSCLGTSGFVASQQSRSEGIVERSRVTMRAWPVARSIFDAPYVREANEGTTSWIRSRAARQGSSMSICYLRLQTKTFLWSVILSSSRSAKNFVKPARLHSARTARALTGRYRRGDCPNF